jgi:hypothetical protein
MFYKLVCKDITITDLYVGTTTDFKSRKNPHKSDCNNGKGENYNLKVYTFIRDNGGWENWDMVMIPKVVLMNSKPIRWKEVLWKHLVRH